MVISLTVRFSDGYSVIEKKFHNVTQDYAYKEDTGLIEFYLNTKNSDSKKNND